MSDDDDHLLDVLALPSWRLHPDGDLSKFAVKHVGVACKMVWLEHVGYLSRGVPGDLSRSEDPEIVKRQEGGWSGGLFTGGWRHHSAFVHTELLTLDIDGNGDVRRAADAFAPFRKAVHTTFKSRPEARRCRVVLQLAKPCIDLQQYKRAHAALRERLYAWGYLRPDKARGVKGDVDEGASDATRLNFSPMHHPDRAFDFLATDGELLDIDRIPVPPKPAPAPTPPRQRNADKYREGALRRAEGEVRGALEGQRHHELFRQAAALARTGLGVADAEIFGALLPAFVHSAGEARRFEGEKTIADAIAKGRAG
jgi:hypothetical protein